MGAEAKTTLRIDGREHTGTALLETDSLLFRSPGYRLKMPFAEMRSVSAVAGRLEIDEASFELGLYAAKWAEKIKNPKGLLDKLGVKPEYAVAVVGVDDASFLAQLESRLNNPYVSCLKQKLDILFLGVETPPDLEKAQSAPPLHLSHC